MRKNTPEQAAAAKARARARRATPEYRAKDAARHAASYALPEVRAAKAARRARPEVKRANTAYNKEYKARPEVKASRAAYDAARYARPEVKAAQLARQTAFLSTPDGKAANAAYKAAHRATPLGTLMSRCCARTRGVFRRSGFKKGSKNAEMLGCEWEFLKVHIEGQFTEGMSWENRHLWHIDHVTPLASAKDEGSLIKLCHYTNLQPLWGKDNLSKGAKMPIAA